MEEFIGWGQSSRQREHWHCGDDLHWHPKVLGGVGGAITHPRNQGVGSLTPGLQDHQTKSHEKNSQSTFPSPSVGVWKGRNQQGPAGQHLVCNLQPVI